LRDPLAIITARMRLLFSTKQDFPPKLCSHSREGKSTSLSCQSREMHSDDANAEDLAILISPCRPSVSAVTACRAPVADQNRRKDACRAPGTENNRKVPQ
jgi:hypothetical protein